MKQRSLLLVIVLVVVAGTAGVFYLNRSGDEVRVSRDLLTSGVCLACQKEAEVEHGLEESAPFACPHCGEQAVYPWFYCEDCNRRFVPQLVRMAGSAAPTVPPAGVICTACRSAAVTQYVPGLTPEPPGDDVPLPRWP